MTRFWGQQWLVTPLGLMLWRSARCLFILSSGRSGTMTAIRLLERSPDVLAFHEPKPRLLSAAKQAYFDLDRRPAAYRGLFTLARCGLIGEARLRGRAYAEATNLVSFAPLMHAMLPKAVFVHLHRHPADWVRSGMRRGWYRGHPWDSSRMEPPSSHPERGKWANLDRFGKICWVWSAINGFILDFLERIEPHRGVSLRFDDLVDAGSGAADRLFDLLEVARPDPEAVRRVLAVKTNRQMQGDFPAYENWTESHKKALSDLAGDTMERLGYECR